MFQIKLLPSSIEPAKNSRNTHYDPSPLYLYLSKPKDPVIYVGWGEVRTPTNLQLTIKK